MQLQLIRHDTVDSTSERAFAALAAGTARHGDVHVATAQTVGRGRRGASWYSPAGEGLYLSVVLRWNPQDRVPPEAPSLAGALAVRAGLAELGLGPREGLALKWPNDLLVRGAKLAGVLAESRGYDPARPHCVLGIGVNVAQRTFPSELRAERPVTSLAQLGIEADAERALATLLEPLAERIERCRDAEALAAEYLEASGLAGEDVLARTASGEHRGRLVELSLTAGIALEGVPTRLALGHVRALERAGG